MAVYTHYNMQHDIDIRNSDVPENFFPGNFNFFSYTVLVLQDIPKCRRSKPLEKTLVRWWHRALQSLKLRATNMYKTKIITINLLCNQHYSVYHLIFINVVLILNSHQQIKQFAFDFRSRLWHTFQDQEFINWTKS